MKIWIKEIILTTGFEVKGIQQKETKLLLQ
jgi:hypothetical protein